jgi:hypothetical protein
MNSPLKGLASLAAALVVTATSLVGSAQIASATDPPSSYPTDLTSFTVVPTDPGPPTVASTDPAPQKANASIVTADPIASAVEPTDTPGTTVEEPDAGVDESGTTSTVKEPDAGVDGSGTASTAEEPVGDNPCGHSDGNWCPGQPCPPGGGYYQVRDHDGNVTAGGDCTNPTASSDTPAPTVTSWPDSQHR